MGEEVSSIGHAGNIVKKTSEGGGGGQSGLNVFEHFWSAYNKPNTDIKETIDKALSGRPHHVILATLGLDSIFSAAATSGGFKLESLGFLKFAPLDLLNLSFPTPNTLISGKGKGGGVGR